LNFHIPVFGSPQSEEGQALALSGNTVFVPDVQLSCVNKTVHGDALAKIKRE
jgi:hypothetical protein